MVGKTKTATVKEKARMNDLSASGCLCCVLASGNTRPSEVHHLTSAGRRNGHMCTSALCEFHHRGHISDGQTKQSMSGLVGPSYAWGRRGFQEFFGSDDLLLKIQDLILSHFHENPWYDYIVPTEVRRLAVHEWIKGKNN